MPTSPEEEPAETWRTASPLTLGVGCITFLFAAALFLLVIGFAYGVFRYPSFARLRDAEQLIGVLGNVAVVCYAFPAYGRTKRHAFLALGFAALSFAYGVLFDMALEAGPAVARWRLTPSQVQWYYATRHISGILGLFLYAYGAVSLARSARVADPSEDLTRR